MHAFMTQNTRIHTARIKSVHIRMDEWAHVSTRDKVLEFGVIVCLIVGLLNEERYQLCYLR